MRGGVREEEVSRGVIRYGKGWGKCRGCEMRCEKGWSKRGVSVEWCNEGVREEEVSRL